MTISPATSTTISPATSTSTGGEYIKLEVLEGINKSCQVRSCQEPASKYVLYQLRECSHILCESHVHLLHEFFRLAPDNPVRCPVYAEDGLLCTHEIRRDQVFLRLSDNRKGTCLDIRKEQRNRNISVAAFACFVLAIAGSALLFVFTKNK